MGENDFKVERLSPGTIGDHLKALGALLNACVTSGASVSFVLPHTLQDSVAFWSDDVRPAMTSGGRVLWVAKADRHLAGSVQLDCDTPPNQPHRAAALKLLVHPDFRRLGIARALMVELENHAKRLGRTLITLDTASDNAERLYLSLGYVRVGEIPDYSKDPIEDRYEPTTIMFKTL